MCESPVVTMPTVTHRKGALPVIALRPVVLDRHVLALDIAGFAKALRKCGHVTCGAISRTTADKPDHRQRRLLGARSARAIWPLCRRGIVRLTQVQETAAVKGSKRCRLRDI